MSSKTPDQTDRQPGSIVAGCLSPHPPHLVYATNPVQNEPDATGAGAWKPLLEGYESLRASLDDKEFDVIIIHTPHWKTVVGHHFLGLPRFNDLSVDPIFPNLFRFNYDLNVDVELSLAIAEASAKKGLVTKIMNNPDFRVDYGTITSCHLARPQWDTPIVVLSSGSPYYYYSNDYGDAEMMALGEATREAVERLGRKALLLASTSLSHRHYTEEPDDPEDPMYESIYNPNQSSWDERIMGLIRQGNARQILAEMPDFIEQSVSECKEGGFTWLLGALGVPSYPGYIHGYGSVIGTGNAIVEWNPPGANT
jgi:2-aminophenol/2-amino-5-chlorophenol 1,6-dioxygenase beta subunit